MSGFLGGAYLWVKAFHVIAMVAWMAGMLYLPRLYVYHCAAAPGSPQSEIFKTMERRLLRAILNPAMIATWLLGLALAAHLGIWSEPWFHAKLAAVVLLSGVHGLFSRWRRQLERDERPRSAGFYRAWNEVPALFLVAIVILVVVRPF